MAAFFLLGIGFLIAGSAVAVLHRALDWAPGHWLALHLVFVGGISQLVLGAGQFFAGAFLATDPPSRPLVRLQLAAWNAGTLLVAAGVPTRTHAVTIAGGAFLALGLAAFSLGLRTLRQHSLQRAPWAVRWYQACTTFLTIGVLVGILLATGTDWPAGSLLGAHMALNLAGWFGTAILGTLHTFFPSLTQTQLRFPPLQRPTFGCWIAGTACLAVGYGSGVGALVLLGWLALTIAAGLLCANLAGSWRATPGTLGLPARLIVSAQACLVLALALSLTFALAEGATAPPAGPGRAAVAVLLLPGWLGLTVLGSLLHLLAVLLRVRDLRRPLPRPRPVRDRLVVTLALSAVLTLAGSHGTEGRSLAAPATAAMLAAYIVLGVLVLSPAALAVCSGPPRI